MSKGDRWQDWFIGPRLLSGVWHMDICAATRWRWLEQNPDDVMNTADPSTCMQMLIDGVLWRWIEDPADGYRSYTRVPQVCPEMPCNVWPTSEHVTGYMVEKVPCSWNKSETKFWKEGFHHYDPDIADALAFVSNATDRIVCLVGTISINDYYPYTVSAFYPENMGINQGREQCDYTAEIDMTGKGGKV